jgi:hypothetical protein
MPFKGEIKRIRDREYQKRWYYNNKDKVKAKQARRTQKLRQLIRDLRAHPCTDCHQSFPWFVMEFDHREKPLNGKRVGYYANFGMKRLLAEVAKCDLVCANCHCVRTHQRRIQSRTSIAAVGELAYPPDLGSGSMGVRLAPAAPPLRPHSRIGLCNRLKSDDLSVQVRVGVPRVGEFTCPNCNILFTKPLCKVRHNQGKQNKCGPFCGKRCSALWFYRLKDGKPIRGSGELLHGTSSAYKYGKCRCVECTNAHRIACKRYRDKKRHRPLV